MFRLGAKAPHLVADPLLVGDCTRELSLMTRVIWARPGRGESAVGRLVQDLGRKTGWGFDVQFEISL
jgi:hypothetical protein